MSLADVFAPIEAHYRAKVLEDTWGHLAPKKNKIYRGSITFAVGIYGNDPLNPTVIAMDFDIGDSPWFYGAMETFLSSLEKEEGGVYKFVGSFRNYEFKGEVRRLKLT